MSCSGAPWPSLRSIAQNWVLSSILPLTLVGALVFGRRALPLSTASYALIARLPGAAHDRRALHVCAGADRALAPARPRAPAEPLRPDRRTSPSGSCSPIRSSRSSSGSTAPGGRFSLPDLHDAARAGGRLGNHRGGRRPAHAIPTSAPRSSARRATSGTPSTTCWPRPAAPSLRCCSIATWLRWADGGADPDSGGGPG